MALQPGRWRAGARHDRLGWIYIKALETCGDDPQCPVTYRISENGRTLPTRRARRWKRVADRCGPHVIDARDGTMLVTSCASEISASEDRRATWQTVSSPT